MSKPRTPQPGFGRVRSKPDPVRMEKYSLRAALPEELALASIEDLPTFKYMEVHYPRLHQRQTSQCTIFSGDGCLRTGKNVIRMTHTHQEMYDWAQRNDPWPGVEPEYYGTSTEASGRAFVHYGYAREFRWIRTIDDMIRRNQYGPFLLGTDWWEHMSNLDSRGFARIGGEWQGGHQYMVYGYNRIERKFRVANSWGNEWGQNGLCWMSFDTVRDLLGAGGEAMVLMERRAA